MLWLDYGTGCLDKAKPLLRNLSVIDRAIASILLKEAFVALVRHELPTSTEDLWQRWTRMANYDPYKARSRTVSTHKCFLVGEFTGPYADCCDLYEALSAIYKDINGTLDTVPDIVSDILLDMHEPVSYDVIAKYLPRDMDWMDYSVAEIYVKNAVHVALTDGSPKLHDCVEHYLENLNERVNIYSVMREVPVDFLDMDTFAQQQIIADIVSKM